MSFLHLKWVSIVFCGLSFISPLPLVAQSDTLSNPIGNLWFQSAVLVTDSSWDSSAQTEREFGSYRQQYHLPGTDEKTGSSVRQMKSSGYRIFLQEWHPANPQATVLITHGYLDHTGLHSRLIGFLLGRGYRVVSWDLPGHGLSDGPRGAIDSFAVYTTVFGKVVGLVKESFPGPLHVIGHSTGCLVAFNFLASARVDPFDSVVFVAPLARHFLWEPGVFGHAVLKKTGITRLPRMVMNVSGDEAFNNLLRHDPLNSGWVPVSWPAALYAWEQNRPVCMVSRRRVLLLTGTHDTVVDATWNMNWYQQVLPSAEVMTVPGGRHHLLNEEPAIREVVYQVLGRVFP